MKHGSLFSGIGGFDLAAQWAGIENVFSVEKDPFAQEVLKKRFPEVEIHGDIFEFDGRKYQGAIDIISGGFPCQPFSKAGKQHGSKDDRHLWPEMFRVVQEVKPRWVIIENVRNLLVIDGGQVYEQVLQDLENASYQTQSFIIPAVSTGAPHRRDRLWIIANANSNVCDIRSRGISGEEETTTQEERRQDGQRSGRTIGTVHSEQITHHREGVNDDQSATNQYYRQEWEENWLSAFSRIYRVPDGLSRGMDGLIQRYYATDRKRRNAALGNAIVPHVAFIFMKGIIEVERVNAR